MSNRSKHIVILTSQHITANPRVWKEANALYKYGYKVTILTTWYSLERLHADQKLFSPGIDYRASINLIPQMGSLADRWGGRLMMKIAYLLKIYFKIDTEYLLQYRPSKQLRIALAIPADIYIAHQESGLLLGCKLIKLGKKVAFDFEDWYSRDYLNESRPVNLLERLEKFALAHGLYCSCPSEAMSIALKKEYQANIPIIVIYNGFSIEENKDLSFQTKDRSHYSLVWFSQTIGAGRGLETLLDALKWLQHPIHLHLIGDCDVYYRQILETSFPHELGHKLHIHDRVLHQELLSLLVTKQIGLAIENNFPDNKDKTISNKILQYIQAGIKVLATSTQGQEEVAIYFPKTVKTVNANKPKDWAKEIDWLLETPIINTEEQLSIFNQLFSWEAQENKLIITIKEILAKD